MGSAPSDETVTRGLRDEPPRSGSADDRDREYILAKVRATLSSPENIHMAAGQRIGRFLVLDEVGHGGMGTVYAAYDEQLDRKVAVKVMRIDGLPTEEDRQRFIREAQALARLSHPNVVTIHEVGRADGALFIATEFLQGQSLGDWQRTEPGWTAILEAYVQAGRGLAGAHEEGLIHRDFKPGNVMRTTAGVVKVLDFGLARRADAPSEESDSTTTSALHPSLSSLTRPGVLMGTPAYMSPEQHEGHEIDVRSDQYSFCVALWEALVGTRPFDDSTLDAMRKAKGTGPPPWPSLAAPVPRRIADVLRRGLCPSPDDRWPSMAELLEQLAWDPAPRRNRRVAASLGVVALGGALGLGAWFEGRAQRCSGARDELAGTWDDQRRAQVKAALFAIERPYAEEVSANTRRELDRFANEWVTMHTEACEATTIRGEQSPRTLDLRMACLERSKLELRAFVDTLAEADAAVVRNAYKLTSGLRPLSRCADTEALAADVEPPPPEEAEAVEQIRAHLSRARSLERAGRYEDGMEAFEIGEELAQTVTYGPIDTEIALLEASLLSVLGEYDASEAALTRALELASHWGQPEQQARAALELMSIVGSKQRRMQESLRYWPVVWGFSRGKPRLEWESRSEHANILSAQGKHAEAEQEARAAIELLQDMPEVEDLALARVRHELASILWQQGRFEDAEVEQRAVIAIDERVLGPSHPNAAKSHLNLAATLFERGQHADAEVESKLALERLEQALGPQHPDVAAAHHNLAVIWTDQGRNREAEAEFRAAIDGYERAYGAEHITVIRAQSNLAVSLQDLGRYEESAAESRAVLAVLERSPEPDVTLVASSQNNLALSLEALGQLDAALAQLHSARARWEEALGPDHPRVGMARGNMCPILLALGRRDEAEREVRAAIDMMTRALGADHLHIARARRCLADVMVETGRIGSAEGEYRKVLDTAEAVLGEDDGIVADIRTKLASVLLELGHTSEALTLAEKAWERQQRDDVSPQSRGLAAFVLARVLWEIEGESRDRGRSQGLAEDALRSYGKGGGGDEVDRVRQWLVVH